SSDLLASLTFLQVEFVYEKRLPVCLSEKYPSDNLIPFLQVQQLCYDVTTFPTNQDVLHDNQRHQPDANQLLDIYCRDFLQFQWQVESFLHQILQRPFVSLQHHVPV